MIFTIVGKPGGGKSLYSLRHIVNVLVHTQNSVVTNLSVNVPELHAYLAKKYPDKDIDTPSRIRLLTVEQSRRFWLHRVDSQGLHVDLEGVSRDDEKQGKHVDYGLITEANRDALAKGLSRVYPGIDFIIDECHVFFDARSWGESGLSLTYYNSQHRKLDDNALFVTQFLELIDKRVKSFSQEFIYLRNNAAEKFLTLFRGPSYFTAKHYQRPPTGLQDMPSEVHRFSLDIPLANCYDTSAGVGISGVGRPEAKRKTGFNILWLLVPFLGFLAFLSYAPDFLASSLLGTDTGKYSAETLGLTQGKPESATAGPATERAATPPPVAGSTVAPRPDPVYPTGFVILASRVNVIMSDGTILTERDSELNKIERNSVTIDGIKTFIKAAPRPQNYASPGTSEIKPMGSSELRHASPGIVQGQSTEPSGWVQGSDGVWRTASYSPGPGR